MKNILLMILLVFMTRTLTKAQQYAGKLAPVATFGKNMPIGLSVNSANRIFVSFPNHDGDGRLALAELSEGRLLPYPDDTWNVTGNAQSFLRVQDLYVDQADCLWVLDSKPSSSGNIFGGSTDEQPGKFKLVKINTLSNKVERIYHFEDLDKEHSALNDLRVDTARHLAYLSDPGLASIIVLDLKTGKTRSLLAKTEFTLADNIVLKYEGHEMRDEHGKAFSSNINSIALSPDNRYLYFKPINKLTLYRIPTAALADTGMSDASLKKQVENMAEVGITHGLITDKRGNIYLSTSESFSISYLKPDGQIEELVSDPALLWPDSFGIGSDGYLYFSCSQLQRQAQWNNGVDRTSYPFSLFKVKLPGSN